MSPSYWIREAMAEGGHPQPISPFRTDKLSIRFCKLCRSEGRKVLLILLGDCYDGCPGGKDCGIVQACPRCDGP